MSETSAIHRIPCEVGVEFIAPYCCVTFGWQESRRAFSMWCHREDEANKEERQRWLIVATGQEFPFGFVLHDSVVLPDGHHVFHLLAGPPVVKEEIAE